MILVGQYDSPYTRRVAVSLGLLGFGFEHDTRSVFGDFDSMRTDQSARPRPLADPAGRHDADRFGGDPRLARPVRSGQGVPCCRQAAPSGSRRCSGSRWRRARSTRSWPAAYERLVRPLAHRWPDWIARCRTQAEGGHGGVGQPAVAGRRAPRPGRASPPPAWSRYVRLADPGLLPRRPPSRARCAIAALRSAAALPERPHPAEYALPPIT